MSPTGVYDHSCRITHGHCKKGAMTPEFRAFCHAKQRCNNPSDKGYPHYGGRGIKFLYNSFEEFLEDVGLKPSPELQLDREKNNGNYEPGNCRWVTKTVQMQNTRFSIPRDKVLEVLALRKDGELYEDIAEEVGISRDSMQRICTKKRRTS